MLQTFIVYNIDVMFNCRIIQHSSCLIVEKFLSSYLNRFFFHVSLSHAYSVCGLLSHWFVASIHLYNQSVKFVSDWLMTPMLQILGLVMWNIHDYGTGLVIHYYLPLLWLPHAMVGTQTDQDSQIHLQSLYIHICVHEKC